MIEEAYKLVSSLEELKQICDNNPQEFFILLSGVVRSSKRIEYDSDFETFDVYNEIDDTWQENLTDNQLKTRTLIVDAINKKQLYKY